MALVSFQHRFIFIKTTKTAGTSLETHFEPDCGPDAIVTPFVNRDDYPARNYERDGQTFYNHMTAQLIRRCEPEAFSRFYKFCFERHPIDKCLSHCAMLINAQSNVENRPKSWEDYVERGKFPVDTPKYVDRDGRLIVDRIYRYEAIEDALDDISRRVTLPRRPLVARLKSHFRHGVPSVEEVMRNGRQSAAIMSAFASSLQFTPYTFDL